jgi:heme A synthase
MRVAAECPHCTHQFSAPKRLAGWSIACPKCKERFTLDPPPEQEEPAIQNITSGQIKRRQPIALNLPPEFVSRFLAVFLGVFLAGLLLLIIVRVYIASEVRSAAEAIQRGPFR